MTLLFWRQKAALVILMLLPLVLTGNAVVSWRNASRLLEHDEWVTHSYQVLLELETLLSLTQDAETGQRGYVITGRASYLEPFDRAAARVGAQLDVVADLTADNPSQQERMAALRQAVTAKLSELTETVALRRTGGFEAARQVVLTDRGRDEMDSVRRVVAAMGQEEQDLLRRRSQDAEVSFRRLLVTFLLSTAAALTLWVLSAYFIRRSLRERQRAEEILREANATLEQRVGERTAALEASNRDSSAEIQERKRLQSLREALIAELQQALAAVKTLAGLLPVCAWCRKVRNDEGYWKELEAFVLENSEVTFTHGICPECKTKVQGDFNALRRAD